MESLSADHVFDDRVCEGRRGASLDRHAGSQERFIHSFIHSGFEKTAQGWRMQREI